MIVYSTNSNSIHIRGTGFKEVINSNQSYKYDDKLVDFYIHFGNNVTATTSWKDFGKVIPQHIFPKNTIQFMEQFGAIILRIKSDGILQYRSITGGNVDASSLVAHTTWII